MVKEVYKTAMLFFQHYINIFLLAIFRINLSIWTLHSCQIGKLSPDYIILLTATIAVSAIHLFKKNVAPRPPPHTHMHSFTSSISTHPLSSQLSFQDLLNDPGLLSLNSQLLLTLPLFN